MSEVFNETKEPLKMFMEVRIKDCKTIFHPEMAPGVIATQVVTLKYPDKGEEWMVAMKLNEMKQEFLESVVEVKMTQENHK